MSLHKLDKLEVKAILGPDKVAPLVFFHSKVKGNVPVWGVANTEPLHWTGSVTFVVVIFTKNGFKLTSIVSFETQPVLVSVTLK